ncbi:MSMEG_6728 family protein [Arthrobacter gengyunqii]|uniref:MSMEG_6728 family protein n=1 Tax=Arthrobacter gengyunqii TaxID=2886940 RepID=A0A9X1M1F1_9MICC|nr:MSMEG_6728 family protein [Arthrobacter gengyunqii]MCC3269514.1 MSMEG_6728 family protein [Arthrobacter gengyunqii]MCC3271001.1 MSMEG_6728 family protein [Arthrobacter gengyunqii]UOY96988.1 MSMEG_6728 family protein [Arthrobacter gengyunqii]
MQTFLPYDSFSRSAAVLDQARLGKQRVETLQVLRALVIPDYGWQSHPAMRMWMGHIPALTAYGLAMTNEWTSRGHTDTVYEQILEFAPEAADDDVVLPPWFGDAALHESHRSNLITKAPDFYAPLFPDTRGGLPYVWPEPEHPVLPSEPAGDAVWVARPSVDKASGDPVIELPMLNGKGTPITGKRGRELVRFLEDMDDGDDVVLLGADRAVLSVGTVGPVSLTNDTAKRSVRIDGTIPRAAFRYPALLQDPRTLFRVPRPAALG